MKSQSSSLVKLSKRKHYKENVDASLKSESELLLKSVPTLKDSFIIRQKIGEGTFSSVYLATIVDCPGKLVAIKHVIPTSHPNRICMELNCMQKFGGKANIMEVESCIRFGSHFIMIMPYFRHNKFMEFLGKMDLNEIRKYFRNLLEALKCVHAGGVIHRDIKPSNFLYNRNLRRYALVDFGLAQYADNFSPSYNTQQAALSMGSNSECTIKTEMLNVSPANDTAKQTRKVSTDAFTCLVPSKNGISSFLTKRSSASVAQNQRMLATKCDCFRRPRVCKMCLRRPQQTAARAGTPGYRPPEVLLKHAKQTTAVDIWAVGIMLFSLLSGRYPIFDAYDDLSALAEIVSLFGTNRVREFAVSIGKTLTCSPEQPSQDLGNLCDKLRLQQSPSEGCSIFFHEPDLSVAYDFLRKLMALDPNDRISAADALLHPFFSL